jgi:hypothetical protein
MLATLGRVWVELMIRSHVESQEVIKFESKVVGWGAGEGLG